MEEKLKFCPYCGKSLAVDAPFCAYCGKELPRKDSKEQPIETKTQTEDKPNQQNLQKIERQDNNPILRFSKQRPFMVFILGCIIAIFIFTAINTSTNSKTNNQEKSNLAQIQKKESKYDILEKSKPYLKLIKVVNKKVFKNEHEAVRKITLFAEKSAEEAIKLLTGNDLLCYFDTIYDEYEAPNKEYSIYTTYLYPETVTHPQPNIMDFWVALVEDTYKNGEYQENNMVLLSHAQFDKQKNAMRTIERKLVLYENNKPTLYSTDTKPLLKVPEEETKFRELNIPWQKMKNERLRKFYELF